MSVTVDPSKKTQTPFLNVEPLEPRKSESKKQPAIVLDAPVSGPKPDFTALLAAQLPQKLSGAGVSGAVYGGAISPNLKAMSDTVLATNIAKLGQAMKASPGKVNDADFKNLKAMIDEANVRGATLLASNKPAAQLDNRDLFASLVMFDAARASGKKLTPDQEKRLGALEVEWKKRGTYDKSGELAHLMKERTHLEQKLVVHCSAAMLSAASLGTHVGAFGMVSSGLVLSHAAHEKEYGSLALETGLAVAARFPMTHHLAEGAATAINAFECVATFADLQHVDAEIKKASTP